MRLVYAIMAHAHAEQLQQLIDRLLRSDSEDRVVLHIDAGSPLWREHRARFASHATGRLHLVPDPARVVWGHYSQVEAHRRLLRTALAEPFDYFHLIRGADWPIATRDSMVNDIKTITPRKPVFVDLWGDIQANRMDDWWFDHPKISLPRLPRFNVNAQRAQIRASWLASRWLHNAGIERRQFDTQPWLKGSSWYSLPWDAAQVLERETSALLETGRLRFTQCADEHVAPTILARRFGDVLLPARRYIDWSRAGNHPKLLREADRAEILQSGAWFARKFDARIDPFFTSL